MKLLKQRRNMKNFWLERKQDKKPFVKLRSSYGTTLEFVDLSHQIQHNNHYKEYERLKALPDDAFDFESKEEYKGIQFRTSSGHNFVMTDDYQDFDLNSEPEPEKVTWPHIYGFKTPDKHTIGNINEDEPAYTKRWKRMEITSSMGATLIIKDNQPKEN